ncbi:hypothetical protein C6497_17620 [Candidatus Poribacteria bacterium]|nr:MAG: hypothetical protein C6497_17620 [Candidatus Poribacteria bacterium]
MNGVPCYRGDRERSSLLQGRSGIGVPCYSGDRESEFPPTGDAGKIKVSVMRKWEFLLFLPLLFVGCSTEPLNEADLWQITFLPLGAKLQFTENAPIKKVSTYNSDGTMVAQIRFPTHPRQIESLYFEWKEGESYRFEATLFTDQVIVKTVSAPRDFSRGDLEIAIPYGTRNVSTQQSSAENNQRALLLQGSEMTATVIVKNGNTPATFDLELCLPRTLKVIRVPERWKVETTEDLTCYSITDSLSVASEVWHRDLVVKIPELSMVEMDKLENQDISAIVRFNSVDGREWEQRRIVQFSIATVPEISEYLSIESVKMPTDAAGIADPRQREDSIFYPRPLFGWLSSPQNDKYTPTVYQTVHIRNKSDETIHVVVASINRDMSTGEPVRFLAPPDEVNAGTDRSVSFASLPAGELTPIPLPIYFHALSAKAGEYEREITVKIWGSDTTVLSEKRPLHIIVPNRHALFVCGLAILSSTIGLVVLLRFHRQFFTRFSTKQLIVIALFGTTIFVAVVVPSTLFLNLITVFLGPISVLVTGIINETLYYALLTALLIYIYGSPNDKSEENVQASNKGGVILLVSAVRLLLGGITFGLFTPMTFIYTGTSVILLEMGFFLVRRRGLLLWGIVLGICDAIAVYVDFQLSILFYRLFFADWYIVLRIFIEGFAYTFIGVLLGAKLGKGLWKVAD